MLARAAAPGDNTRSSCMNSSYIIVTPTYHRVAKYCNLILHLLDAFWPNHPSVIFLSDHDGLSVDNIFVKPTSNWLDIFYNGLVAIKSSNPEITHVFLLLDDHYPLRHCDEDLISAIYAATVNNELACVSYVTYAWPWSITEKIDYPDGMIRTWRKIDIAGFDNCEMARVPAKFFRYFQLQPSFWQLDYLIDICREAYEKQCFDPWRFESFAYSKPRQHYISRYKWPSVHHGFLSQGKINPEAIDFIQMPEGRGVRRLLLKEAIGLDSIVAFRLLRYLQRMGSRISSRARYAAALTR
jgi:hypothetical protein